MATVYLARDLKHDRNVAIKVLRPEIGEALGAERFLLEIKTTANLRHPHIVPLYDSGDVRIEAAGEITQTLLYYVMPLLEGESLRERKDRDGQLPIDDALRIASEVADALSYAHARGVVHRDIKPENIMLEAGHAVVADFGIVRALRAAGGARSTRERITQTGMSVGTPDLARIPETMPVVTFDHIPMAGTMELLGGYTESPPAPTLITVNGKTVYRQVVSNAAEVLSILRVRPHVFALDAHIHAGEKISYS